jgi:Flp pilus assembly protein TadD
LVQFEAAQTENADRPESLVNLGNICLSGGEADRAEAAYRRAMTLDVRFVPAYANLADLYRAGRRDAERVLRDVLIALAAFTREAGDPASAARNLARLAEINPDDPALSGLAGTR